MPVSYQILLATTAQIRGREESRSMESYWRPLAYKKKLRERSLRLSFNRLLKNNSKPNNVSKTGQSGKTLN